MSTLDTLTRRELDVLHLIAEHCRRCGYSPTLDMLAEHLGVSRSAVRTRVLSLVGAGLLNYGKCIGWPTLTEEARRLLRERDEVTHATV